MGYRVPFKQRKGTLDGHHFYLTVPFTTSFTAYFWLNVDRDHNDTLEIGSGTNEVSSIDFGKMFHVKKYYLYPTFKLNNKFWEIADIDPKGTWIRLRPAKNAKAKVHIVVGKMAPKWKGTTIKGQQPSSESLRGKYVLLDFWGSWCGGCIQEIPLLKKVYKQFHSANFELLGFALDTQKSLHKAMRKYQLTWPQIVDPKGDYGAKFAVRGYPTLYLIGPKGDVLEMGSSLYGKQLIKTLEKYLKCSLTGI